MIKSDVELRLKKIIQEVANKCSTEIIQLETMPDHVHLLVEIDPQADAMDKQLSTVGEAPLEIIKQYVASQKNV